ARQRHARALPAGGRGRRGTAPGAHRLRRGGGDAAHPGRRAAALPERAPAVGGVSVPRASTLGHWESYWRGHADLDRTYSTGGRLARQILRDGPVAGRRGLEVGAGSGRDTLPLAGEGAVPGVPGHSPASLAPVRRQAAERGP